MRDRGAHDDGPGARVDRGAALGGRMDMALADDGQVGELGGRLAQQRQIGTLVQRGLDRGLVVGKRRGNEIEAELHGATDVLDGHAVGHEQHALLLERSHRVLEGLAIGARTIRGIDGDDVRTGRDAGARMAERRGDVNALVAVLPQADDGDLDATFDSRDIGEALAANRSGTAQLAGAGHGGHVLGRAERLARIGLDADDELALKGLDDGMHALPFRHGCW